MAQASPSRPLPDVPAEPARADVPLCVDLDGTLIGTDLLFESFLALARTSFLSLLLVPLWLLKGLAVLKGEIARRVSLDASTLPYRAPVLEWLGREKAAGRRLLLVTASDERLARAVADHLQLFDEVVATTADRNLIGRAKRDELVRRFGAAGFDYVGDSRADLSVWASARQAVVVAAAAGVEKAARAGGNVTTVFPRAAVGLRTIVKVVRAHQWVKNALLFVPLVTAHRLDGPSLVKAGLGALAFSLCASAVYVLNDLMDLESDRRHRSKRLRPFAAGTVPVVAGLVASPLLLVAGAGVALALSFEFGLLLALYLVVTNAYTFGLKREPILDVLCLAALYSLRIFAGGSAVGVPVSDWLIAFSMFFFLSLALVKRAAELKVVADGAGAKLHGRGYAADDLPTVLQAGTASGQLSVLVFAVYVQSETVRSLYAHPWALWFVCPLIFYWLGRVWLLVGRGEMHDDPVVFAVRDRVSYVVGALAALTLFLAR